MPKIIVIGNDEPAKLARMNPTSEWNRGALLQSPLFFPLHSIIAHLGADAFPTLEDCNALLEACHPAIATQSGHALRFVAQEYGKLPFEAQYEPRCYLKGEVQTRSDNWHDLLNALVWLAFPKAKAAINARHYHALVESSRGDGGLRYLGPDSAAGRSERGAVRDTNTLLDESGVFIPYADEELAELLKGFRWKELFWQRRVEVTTHHFDGLRTGMGFYLFGHGLYEKALNPYVGMTGQGLLLRVEEAFFGWPLAQRLAYLDELLAAYLDAPEHCCSTRELTPVPLLGVPGWAADNARAAYYGNTAYFRPGRRKQGTTTSTSGC